MITGYIVPHGDVSDIKKYNQPLTMGIKKKEHQDDFTQLLEDRVCVKSVDQCFCSIENKLKPLLLIIFQYKMITQKDGTTLRHCR